MRVTLSAGAKGRSRRAASSIALAALLLGSGGACSSPLPAAAPSRLPPAARRTWRPALPANLRGITYDDLSSTCAATPGQLAAERRLNRPTIRVVFDRVTPSCYSAAVRQFDRDGYTMGELVDSSGMRRYTLAQIRRRAAAYVAALGDGIDLWEIGNEVNGEWLSAVPCPGTAECPARARDVIAKVQAMYDAVTAAGDKTELTLYYEPPQTVTPGYQMIAWERAYVPSAMRAGLQDVLVSYYEGDNAGIRPTHAQWDAIFKKLAGDFPNARVGFGEIGMARPIDTATLSQALNIFEYYQTMAFPDIPRYTRAGFWWNAAEDLVPPSKWPAFFRTVQRDL
jgi:hypothetical protein